MLTDSYTLVAAARGLETLLGDKANQEETVWACSTCRRVEKCVESFIGNQNGRDYSEEARDIIKTDSNK